MLEEEDCPVDCWVLPRLTSTATFREALYRLLVQGFRRCQGLHAPSELTLAGLKSYREFFSGRPIWRANGGAWERELHPVFQRTTDAWGRFAFDLWGSAYQPVLVETNPLWEDPLWEDLA